MIIEWHELKVFALGCFLTAFYMSKFQGFKIRRNTRGLKWVK